MKYGSNERGTDDYSRNIGADGFASDAASAARLAKELITKRGKS